MPPARGCPLLLASGPLAGALSFRRRVHQSRKHRRADIIEFVLVYAYKSLAVGNRNRTRSRRGSTTVRFLRRPTAARLPKGPVSVQAAPESRDRAHKRTLTARSPRLWCPATVHYAAAPAAAAALVRVVRGDGTGRRPNAAGRDDRRRAAEHHRRGKCPKRIRTYSYC